MSIALLKTLLIVSETESFASAADRLGISQAAVGQQMKRLEELSEQRLFDRSSNRPVLTSDGRNLVERARDLISGYDELMSRPPERQTLVGELRLGAVPSTLMELVPAAIKRLVAEHPDLKVRIVSGLSIDLLDQVERGALDAAITSLPADPARQLRWTTLTREPLRLLTPHACEDTDPRKLLATMPYIRHTRRADAGLLADRWLRKHRIAVQTAMELESLEAVARMVAHGLGVALVPDICMPGRIFDGTKRIDLGGDAPSRDLGVLSKTSNRLVDALISKLNELHLN